MRVGLKQLTLDYKQIFTVIASAGIVLMLLASCWFTGAPYFAAGATIAIFAVAWACMQPKRLVYLLVLYCCIYPFLVSDLGFPRLLNYGGDLINLIALFFSLSSGKFRNVRFKLPCIPFVVFSVVAVLSAMGNGVAPVLFLWEVRNYFRFFVFFVACVGLLDTADLHKIMKLLLVIFSFNLILCSIESLLLGYGQDNTNGLFGSGSGGNAATNILLLEMTCLALFGHNGKVVKLPTLVYIIIGCCWVSIISELKIYFVQLAILILFYVVLTSFSVKKVILTLSLFLCLYLAVQAFYALMPEWNNYFTVSKLIESSATGGYGSAQLNRLTAIETIRNLFITTVPHRLFGLGFGSGTYSQFFVSPLYAKWGEALRWTWFTDAQVYLETGMVGLISYAAFFGFLGIYGLSFRNKIPIQARYLVETGSTMALFCILLMFYNCALTVDPGGYLIFLFLAMPFVAQREYWPLQVEEGDVQCD